MDQYWLIDRQIDRMNNNTNIDTRFVPFSWTLQARPNPRSTTAPNPKRSKKGADTLEVDITKWG